MKSFTGCSLIRWIVFRHSVARIALPEKDLLSPPFAILKFVDSVELHLLRVGDVSLATIPFELSNDYRMRIPARSKGVMIFDVQLSSGNFSCGTLSIFSGRGTSEVVVTVQSSLSLDQRVVMCSWKHASINSIHFGSRCFWQAEQR